MTARLPYKRGSRALMTFYVAHPRSKPCRRCNVIVDPGDVEYARNRTGTSIVVCVACIRAMELEVREEWARSASSLERLQATVDANPGLLVPTREEMLSGVRTLRTQRSAGRR